MNSMEIGDDACTAVDERTLWVVYTYTVCVYRYTTWVYYCFVFGIAKQNEL